ASLVEAAVAVEELGRAMVPGPYTPTVIAGAILTDAGHTAHLEALGEGALPAAVGIDPGGLTGEYDGGDLVLTGRPGAGIGPGAWPASISTGCASRPPTCSPSPMRTDRWTSRPRCWPPRPPGWPTGRWPPPPSTRRCAASSADPSASSRASSTASPGCSPRP